MTRCSVVEGVGRCQRVGAAHLVVGVVVLERVGAAHLVGVVELVQVGAARLVGGRRLQPWTVQRQRPHLPLQRPTIISSGAVGPGTPRVRPARLRRLTMTSSGAARRSRRSQGRRRETCMGQWRL